VFGVQKSGKPAFEFPYGFALDKVRVGNNLFYGFVYTSGRISVLAVQVCHFNVRVVHETD
jgi:hypothetical protein